MSAAEQQVIDQVIAQWHVAGWVHLVNGTKPDQPAADPDDEHVEMLQRVACTCGC